MLAHRGILVLGVGAVGVREDLHRLVDRLPETEEQAARRFLEFLVERADYDEEPLNPEEEAALEEGLRDYRSGKVHSLDEVLPAPQETRRGG
jgi:predicted transcriptional regulator